MTLDLINTKEMGKQNDWYTLIYILADKQVKITSDGSDTASETASNCSDTASETTSDGSDIASDEDNGDFHSSRPATPEQSGQSDASSENED